MQATEKAGNLFATNNTDIESVYKTLGILNEKDRIATRKETEYEPPQKDVENRSTLRATTNTKSLG